MIDLKLGNCLDLMPEIPDDSMDAIIADIPYGTTACSWDTVIPFEPMWKELKRIAKKRAAIVLFGSQPFTSALVMSNPKMFRYSLIWDKVLITAPGVAQYRPIPVHEEINVFSSNGMNYFPQMMQGFKPYNKKDTTIRTNVRSGNEHKYGFSGVGHSVSNGERYPQSIIRISNANQGAKDHSTQKPVALMEYLIRTYTNEGDTVLDFTMGSGTTMVACVNTKRNGIGYELDEGYFRDAQRRVQDARANIGEVAKVLAPNTTISPLFA